MAQTFPVSTPRLTPDDTENLQLAVRIYALAKELNVDSKELVELCNRIGIPGKGSALASVEDHEAAKLREAFAGGGAAPVKGKAAAPPKPERPKENTAAPMRVIVAPVSKGPLAGRRRSEEAPVAEEPSTEAAPAEMVAAAEAEAAAADAPAKATSTPAQPASTGRSGPLSRMMKREDYIGPGGSVGKLPNVTPKTGDKEPPKSRRSEKPQKASGPVVKLAAMPAAPPPSTPKPRRDEAPAQKPDMKLPAEVLGGQRIGAAPLAAHLKRAERTLEAERIRQAAAKTAEEESAKARGKKGRGGAATGDKDEDGGRPMLGGREQRQLARRRTKPGGEDDGGPVRTIKRNRRGVGVATMPRKSDITLELPCTVKDMSEAAGIPAAQIIRVLMQEGMMVRITDTIDPDMAELVAAELGLAVTFAKAQTTEDRILSAIRDAVDEPESLVQRPPVVTFLGHVDHGKTSLLDRIIGINVVKGESGGITQHIRAYQIENNGRPISFVDTPGHEAFTEMRARGANVTDIAVLVVAADDGVMPQTEEAISHIRAAGVPIIVALNKIDLPGIDQNRALQDLAANDLLPSEWGGEVEVIRTSAQTGAGIDELLDTILTVAELHEYKANPNRPQDADRGVMTKVMVQKGTLKVGDVIVCGDAYGRVKAMFDTLDRHQRVAEAGPSRPVNLVGFDEAPSAGQPLYVLDDIGTAREIAETRSAENRVAYLGSGGYQHVTLETLFDRLEGEAEVQTLNLILRADTRGSIEAIEKELTKLEHPEVRLKLLQRSVGAVTDGDVLLAQASEAVIIAFNVIPDDKARSRSEREGIEIRRYDVIYKITDDLKAAMEGMLKPEEREVSLGRALVQQVFRISRVGAIAGCRVLSGVIERSARCRVVRDSTVIGDYAIDTLRREKDDAKEVREGYECGIKLAGFNDIKEGDLLDAYKVEQIGRSFDDTQ